MTSFEKKAFGFDMITSKLLKMAANVLCEPLPNVKNNSLSKGIFQTTLKLPWFRRSTKAILKRMIYRIFDQLVF